MGVEKTDSELSIGEVARQTKVAASALRYYEKERLILPARRVGGKRRFDRSVVPRVEMIRFAQQVGFTIAEVRTLLVGFDRDGLPATWRRMAGKKLEQLEEDAKRIAGMRKILSGALSCGCVDLPSCVGAVKASTLSG